MHKVLVPFDGSEHSRRALDYMIDLVGKFAQPPEIHIFHVQASPIVYSDYLAPDMIEGVKRGLYNEANLVLEEAVKRLTVAGVRFESHVDLGNVAEQVKVAVTRLGCDTVVMGTRGLGSFGGLLLGSVANRVVHEVSVPVILIK